MEKMESSIRIKTELDEQVWKDLFFIRVQYTCKTTLSINKNSPMEYDRSSVVQKKLFSALSLSGKTILIFRIFKK